MGTTRLPQEYLLLEQQRQQLAEKRQELERKCALRQNMLAELTAVSKNAAMQALSALKKDNEFARARNRQLLQDLQQLSHKFNNCDTTEPILQTAKKSFVERVEHAYPLWQETALKAYQNRLEQIEAERRRVEYRRRINQEAYARRQAMETAVLEMQGQLALEKTREQEEELERQLRSSAQQHQVRLANELLTKEAMHRTLETRNKLAQQLQEDEASLLHHFSERASLDSIRHSSEILPRPPPARMPSYPAFSSAYSTTTATSNNSAPDSPTNSVGAAQSSVPASSIDDRQSHAPAAAPAAAATAAPVALSAGHTAVRTRPAVEDLINTSQPSRIALPETPESQSTSPTAATPSAPPTQTPEHDDEGASPAATTPHAQVTLPTQSATATPPAPGTESDNESEDVGHDTAPGRDAGPVDQALRLAEIVQREHQCARCLQDMFALTFQSAPAQLTAAYSALRGSAYGETSEVIAFVQSVKGKSIWNDEHRQVDAQLALTSCCLLIQLFAQDLLPAELLSGVVTLPKVLKALKPKGPGLAEIWSQIEQHLQLLTVDANSAIDPALAVFTELFMKQLSVNQPKQEQTRLQRKVSSLFSSIVQSAGSSRAGSPTKSRPTTPTSTSAAQSDFQTPRPLSPEGGKKITNISEPYMLSRPAFATARSQSFSDSSHASKSRAGESRRSSRHSEGGGYEDDDNDDDGEDSALGASGGMSFLRRSQSQTPLKTPASSLLRKESGTDDEFW